MMVDFYTFLHMQIGAERVLNLAVILCDRQGLNPHGRHKCRLLSLCKTGGQHHSDSRPHLSTSELLGKPFTLLSLTISVFLFFQSTAEHPFELTTRISLLCCISLCLSPSKTGPPSVCGSPLAVLITTHPSEFILCQAIDLFLLLLMKATAFVKHWVSQRLCRLNDFAGRFLLLLIAFTASH